MPEKKRIKRLIGHTNIILKQIFDEGRSELLTISLDNTLKIWDIQTGNCRETIILPYKHPKDLDYLTFDKHVVITFEYNKVIVFSIQERSVKFTY